MNNLIAIFVSVIIGHIICGPLHDMYIGKYIGTVIHHSHINWLIPEQSGCDFVEYTLECIFFNKVVFFYIRIN